MNGDELLADLKRIAGVGDGRAVSSPLGYVLDLGIMFVVMSGLTIAGAQFTQAQADTSVENRMEVVGQQTATAIEFVDRLVRSTESNSTQSFEAKLPEQVPSQYYRLHIYPSGTLPDADAPGADQCGRAAGTPDVGCIVAYTNDESIVTTTYFATSADPDVTVEEADVRGGSVRVLRPDKGAADWSQYELVVRES